MTSSALLLHEQARGHSSNGTPVAVEPCRTSQTDAVGHSREAFFEPMSVEEIERHVADAGVHMEAAYARFQASRDPADREEAKRWMQLQNEAIRARNERIGGARHAEFEQRITDGVDFFQSPHALALARGLA